LTDYLFDNFARGGRDILGHLTAQAGATRRALDAEYDGQVERLARWLASRV
jgi:hypothetical protein